MLSSLLIASLIGLAAAVPVSIDNAACGFPNGTETAFKWWQGEGTADFQILTLEPIDAKGNDVYPVYLNQPLRVKAHFINNQNDFVAGKLLLSMKLSKYGSWSGCAWNEINTQNLLNNQDACEADIACPVVTGEHDMIITLDFSKHKVVISMLENDAPYQLQLTLTDQTSNTYVTVYTQTRCFTK